ncbi:MAG: hypothetical protein VZR73_06330 [Acutalibacteraceae bacterium]|nr:hypothetical protein [Acutalibacteraceae bacterium]
MLASSDDGMFGCGFDVVDGFKEDSGKAVSVDAVLSADAAENAGSLTGEGAVGGFSVKIYAAANTSRTIRTSNSLFLC